MRIRHSRRVSLSLGVLLLAGCGVAAAAGAAAPAPATSTFLRELLAIVLPLAFIILGLLVVLRLLRQRYGLTGQDAPLSVLQILPVGPRERVILLRTRAGRVLAIGVSANAVGLIARLEPDDVAAGAEADADTATAPRAPKSLLDTVLRR